MALLTFHLLTWNTSFKISYLSIVSLFFFLCIISLLGLASPFKFNKKADDKSWQDKKDYMKEKNKQIETKNKQNQKWNSVSKGWKKFPDISGKSMKWSSRNLNRSCIGWETSWNLFPYQIFIIIFHRFLWLDNKGRKSPLGNRNCQSGQFDQSGGGTFSGGTSFVI